MSNYSKELLNQIVELSNTGCLGELVKKSCEEYSKVQKGLPTVTKFITDFFGEKSEDPIVFFKDYFCKTFIALYKDTKKNDIDIAEFLLNSLYRDYPGIEKSALLPKWHSLGNATLAFKEVSSSNNYLLIWQQSQENQWGQIYEAVSKLL